MPKKVKYPSEDRFLVKCKKDILYKYFGEGLYDLKHSDYVKLSELIFESSKIYISLSTIKRFFDDKYEGMPNISTLDGFAIYLGYNNWNDYRNTEIRQAKSRIRLSLIHSIRPQRKVLLISLPFVIALLIVAAIYSYKLIEKRRIKNIRFSYIIENEKDIPVTVRFSFDIGNIDFTQAKFQPLGNDNDEMVINKNDTVRTYTYLWPDIFFPKLIIDNKEVKVLRLELKTDGWKTCVCNNDNENYFMDYFKDSVILRNGVMGISEEIVKKHNYKIEEIDNITYCNSGDFYQIDGDSFRFETKVKNKQTTKYRCSGNHRIILKFEQRRIELPLTEKDYLRCFDLIVFDKFYPRNKNFLNMLHIDHQKWNTIEITSKNKEVSIMINSKTVYSSEFTVNPGYLKGIDYVFFGLTEVDYVRFYNAQNELVYDDEFD